MTTGPSYNESLVIRCEILLDLNLLHSWEDEMDQINREKEGGRYRYPHSLIEMHIFIKAYFHLPYRQLEGFTRTLSREKPRLKTLGSTTTWCRVNTFTNDLQSHLDSDEWVIIAVDSTGIKVADRGEWRRIKWKRRRGFLKIHIAVDVKS